MKKSFEKNIALYTDVHEEPVIVTVEWTVAEHGPIVRIMSSCELPASFGASTRRINTQRMYHVKEGENVPVAAGEATRLEEEFLKAQHDVITKLQFIWQANHGQLGHVSFSA